MSEAGLQRALGLLGLAAAATLVSMLVVGLQGGISQEPFQAARLVELTLPKLLQNPTALRLNVGLDNLFIVLYSAYFVLFASLMRTQINPGVLAVGLGALLLGSLLDAIENQHILVMLHSAEQNIPLTTGESQLQMVASNVKFHAVYVGSFLFAFAFQRLGAMGTFLALTTWFVFVPLGIVIFMTPVDIVRPLVIGRGLFFIAFFALSGLMFLARSTRSA